MVCIQKRDHWVTVLYVYITETVNIYVVFHYAIITTVRIYNQVNDYVS